MEGGLDWKALSLSPKDMDFMAAKDGAAREIALAFGVPPMLLGIPGDNTYSNYQEATRAFWRQTVLPLCGRLAEAIGGWLAPAFGDGEGDDAGGLRLWYDADQVEALSSEREALWARVGAAAFLSANEKRAAVGYSPVEGGEWMGPDGVKYNFDPEQLRGGGRARVAAVVRRRPGRGAVLRARGAVGTRGAAVFLSANEKRAAVGYGPVEGGEGMGPDDNKAGGCTSCLERRYNPDWEIAAARIKGQSRWSSVDGDWFSGPKQRRDAADFTVGHQTPLARISTVLGSLLRHLGAVSTAGRRRQQVGFPSLHGRMPWSKGLGVPDMDIDLARQMVLVDFKVSRDLQEILQTLKARCADVEYRELARGIAAAVDGVGAALIRKAIEAHPELEAEIDASIEQYGHYRGPSTDLTEG